MATVDVSKSGNDSNDGATSGTAKLTIGAAITLVNAAVGGGIGTNIITIGDGTYTETITYSLSNLTIKSTSSDRTAVIITQSSEKMMKNTEISRFLELQNREFGVWSSGVRAHGLPNPGTTPLT